MKWYTRLDTPLARRLGIEAHTAVFRHRDDPGGAGCVVAVEIPETPDPLIVEALALARAMKARIIVVADSEAQVESMATRMAIACGQHLRVPYERAVAGAFGPLS